MNTHTHTPTGTEKETYSIVFECKKWCVSVVDPSEHFCCVCHGLTIMMIC